jgi:hypothetical protein
MKNPWLAAILNLFFFGGGYVYNGKRRVMGLGLILGWLLIRIGEIKIYLTGLVTDKWLIMFCGLVLLQISFAVDAYRETKEINGK